MFSLYRQYVELCKEHKEKPVSKRAFRKVENAAKVFSQVDREYIMYSAEIDSNFSYFVAKQKDSISAKIVTNKFVRAMKREN